MKFSKFCTNYLPLHPNPHSTSIIHSLKEICCVTRWQRQVSVVLFFFFLTCGGGETAASASKQTMHWTVDGTHVSSLMKVCLKITFFFPAVSNKLKSYLIWWKSDNKDQRMSHHNCCISMHFYKLIMEHLKMAIMWELWNTKKWLLFIRRQALQSPNNFPSSSVLSIQPSASVPLC